MADLEQRAKRHPSDLTDEEWAIVRPLLPATSQRGRKPETDLRRDRAQNRCRTRLQGAAGTLGRRTHLRLDDRWRRLVRDYEQRLDLSEAMIHVAMGSLLLRRIAHP